MTPSMPAAGSSAASTTSVPPQRAAPLGEDRSLRHEVERHILSEIRAGRLRPGDRILEVELARTLGVSLTPIREAIFRLVNFGQVEHVPRRGFYLAKLDATQVEDVYSMRAVLEGLAASNAATRIQPVETLELESLIEEGVAALHAGALLQNQDCNARFHTLIMRAARNALLERAWQLLSPVHWLQLPDREPRTNSEHAATWAANHHRLLDAIKSGDAEHAERVARDHIGRVAARSLARRERAT